MSSTDFSLFPDQEVKQAINRNTRKSTLRRKQ